VRVLCGLAGVGSCGAWTWVLGCAGVRVGSGRVSGLLGIELDGTGGWVEGCTPLSGVENWGREGTGFVSFSFPFWVTGDSGNPPGTVPAGNALVADRGVSVESADSTLVTALSSKWDTCASSSLVGGGENSTGL
jgi:hypothetical protein